DAACRDTILAVRKDGTGFAARARSPLPGFPLVHDRGFLWLETHSWEEMVPSRIWNIDPAGETTTLLVDGKGARWGPSLLGVAAGRFYWQSDQRIARALL